MVDVAMIVLSAVLANHLELIEAVEKVIRHEIPIVNCSKCLTFWSVLAYMLLTGHAVIACIATSFLCAWVATWIELLLGIIDHFYLRIYENFYSETTNAEDTEETVSEVQQIEKEL